MTRDKQPSDLAVLVADRDAYLCIESLLNRSANLGFRAISFSVFKHDNRDNGVFKQGHDYLRAQSRKFKFAITVCDREGCGREKEPVEIIEHTMEQNLRSNGWEGRAAAILIAPELEVWMWGDWHALATNTRWNEGPAALKRWLLERGLIQPDNAKPNRPKETFERVLRQSGIPASPRIFAAVAQNAETDRCVDRAFLKLRSTLQRWFPA
jgi:hypothetical protein